MSFKQFAAALGSAVLVVASAHADNQRREGAIRADDLEAAKWDQRRQDVFATIDRALVADHSRQYVSQSTKERTAVRLRQEAAEYATKRSEPLMRMVEDNANRFERTGS